MPRRGGPTIGHVLAVEVGRRLGCGELVWRRQGGAVHGRDAVRPRHQVGADLDSAVTGDVVVPRGGGENHLICWSLGSQAMTANARKAVTWPLPNRLSKPANTPTLRRRGLMSSRGVSFGRGRPGAAARAHEVLDAIPARRSGALPGAPSRSFFFFFFFFF